MNEVRGLVEEALAEKLATLVDCAVVRGEADAERPDQFVAVVAGSADARGVGNYLVQTEIRVVVPVDDAGLGNLGRMRLRTICDYLDNPACDFRSLQTESVRICGYYVASLDAQKGARSRAEIVRMKIGAAALVEEG